MYFLKKKLQSSTSSGYCCWVFKQRVQNWKNLSGFSLGICASNANFKYVVENSDDCMYLIRILNLLARSPAEMPRPRYRNGIRVPKEKKGKAADPDIDFGIFTDLPNMDYYDTDLGPGLDLEPLSAR